MGEELICWYCDEPITKENNSSEHIIPDCLCGKFERSWILHNECNRKLNIYDDELERQFHPQILLSGCTTKRNKDKIFKAYDENFNTINMVNSSTIRFKLKIIIDDNKVIELEGKTENEVLKKAKKKIAQLNKGGKNYDFDKLKESMKYENENGKVIFFSNGLSDQNPEQSMFGGPILERAVAKMALNFAISQNINFNHKYLANYIKSSHENDAKNYSNIPVRLYNPSYLNVYFPPDEELSHIICVKGDNTEKLLLAYIEIFNFECFLVLLDDKYEGETISFFLKQEINKPSELSNADRFTRNIQFYMKAFEPQNFDQPIVQQRLQDTKVRFERFMKITTSKINEVKI